MTVGHEHALAVKMLMDLNPKLRKLGCHIQVQQPLTLPEINEPEPDGAIVSGQPRDYKGRHPGPADVSCIIEVADSSLASDRTTKQRIYADAGIPQYVIINLPERLVEVYTKPAKGRGRYAEATSVGPRRRLELFVGAKDRLTVSVRTLLP